MKYTIFGTFAGREEGDIEGRGEWDQVFYTQVRNPLGEEKSLGENGDGEGRGGRLELEVFEGGNCEGGRRVRWDCVDREGSCAGVGFGIGSFRVSLVDAEEVGRGNCAVAAAVGGGAGRRVVGWEVWGLLGLGVMGGLWI